MNIATWYKRFEKMASRIDTIDEVAEWAVHDNKKMIVALKKDELLSGVNSDGVPFTPSYMQDPFFFSDDAKSFYGGAYYQKPGAYQIMKDTKEREHNLRHTYPLNYAEKARSTPNLIITGPLHDGIYVTTTPETFTIGSFPLSVGITTKEVKEIEDKYKQKVFPLGPLAKEYFWDNVLYEMVSRHLFGWL